MQNGNEFVQTLSKYICLIRLLEKDNLDLLPIYYLNDDIWKKNLTLNGISRCFLEIYSTQERCSTYTHVDYYRQE